MKKLIFAVTMSVFLILFTIIPGTRVSAWNNGLAVTPPMGWNSWNVFHGDINETQIKQIADYMVSSGMRDAGYVYLNLDDNWMANPARDANGNLKADPTRFPSGMKALGDYIHSKGLKFGIYGCRGSMTCLNIPQSGSYGYETKDAASFASWGVDYLKYDNCNLLPACDMQKDYQKMQTALANCGRPIAFSICAWEYQNWMPSTGNLWRTGGDIVDKWDNGDSWFKGIINCLDNNAKYANAAGPSQWNDAEMLEVGNGGCTTDEYRSQFSLWSIMAAPLIAGNDIRTMTQTTKDMLTNSEVIAVDQDPAGIQGYRVSNKNFLEVWVKPLGSTGTTKAVALFNRTATTANITVNWADVGLTGSATVRDLWAKTDRGSFNGSYTASVPPHGTVLVKITGTPSISLASGTYKFINRLSGKALDIPNSSTADGTQLIQWDYIGGNNQKWSIAIKSDGTYEIKNVNSGKLVDLSGPSYAEGAPIVQWASNAGTNQRWSIISVGGGYYKIVNKVTGKPLVVQYASVDNNAKIVQSDYNATHNDEWQIVAP